MEVRGPYLLHRLGQAVFVLLATYTATFLLLTVLPSDPISLQVYGGESSLGAAEIAALQEFYGFDRPVPQQFVDHLIGVLTGDLGISLTSGRPVLETVAEVLPYTAALAGLALLAAALFSAALLALASTRRFRVLRKVARQVPPLLSAIPPFWLGLLVLQLFSFRLGLIPVIGGSSAATFLAASAALGLLISAGTTQILLHTIEELYLQPFVEQLRASGQSEREIFLRHILRGAAGSGGAVAGLAVAGALTGSVVTETIFNIPGLGKMLQAAVVEQDVAVVQGIVLLVALIFIATNLVIDIAHTWTDPRVLDRVGRAEGIV